MSFLMFRTISFDMEWPLNPYVIGICGGIPGFNILSLSVATKANISAASTRRKLKPSSTKSANCKLVSWKSLSRNIEMSILFGSLQ